MRSSRREFLAGSGAALAADIVLVMADDLGFGELGAYGQALMRTPNLDRTST